MATEKVCRHMAHFHMYGASQQLVTKDNKAKRGIAASMQQSLILFHFKFLACTSC
jgi:hypothetical protein